MTPLLARNYAIVSSLLAVAAVVAALAGGGCTKSAPAAPPAPPPPAVGIAVAALEDVHLTSELTGRVEPIHSVEVRPHIAGYVTAIDYREGADVAAGAVLFTIDPRPYQAALAHATAELARAQARLDLARTDAARAEKLLASSAIAKVERDTAVSGAAQAAADVDAARATVAIARLDVDYTRVRAPLPGRAGQARISVGDYVAAGPAPTLLTTLVSVDPVYVYFTGDEQTYLRFASHAQGAPIAVGLADEPDYPHAGAIDFIDNRLDAATGTIRLRAVVPNADRRLVPGLFARVRLGEGDAQKAIAIDDKAILTDQDRKYVYVLGAGDTVERRDVKLGRIVDGRRLVTDGLKAGDRVIVSGIQKIYPGAKATVAAAPVQTAGVAP